MLPGDFKFPKLTRKKLLGLGVLNLVGIAATVVSIGFMVWLVSAWLGRPIDPLGRDTGPDQPIAFPHTVHVQEVGLDCTFCHREVTKAAAATIPSVGLCMTCHQVVGDDKPEVLKLRATFTAAKPIDWVRVHRLPDHVRFVHEAHIRFFSAKLNVEPSAVCSTCHGDVGAMVKVKQVRSLKMGDCVDCHRDNSAPTDCLTCHY